MSARRRSKNGKFGDEVLPVENDGRCSISPWALDTASAHAATITEMSVPD
jgi:hypothetical protein